MAVRFPLWNYNPAQWGVLWYNSGMQNLICVVALGIVAVGALSTKDTDRVEKTMTVNRCQAVLKDGSQCRNQAETGKEFCWKHRTAKAVDDTMKDAGEGGKKVWQTTKTWSTNVWESTKSGWNKAVDATRESLDDARVGMGELFGGKDVKKAAASKADVK